MNANDRNKLNERADDLERIANMMADAFGEIERLQLEMETLAGDAGEEFSEDVIEIHNELEHHMVSLSCVIEDIEERAEDLRTQSFVTVLRNNLICCPECGSMVLRLAYPGVGKTSALECDTCDTVLKAVA